MNPINFAVVILALTVTICWGGIIVKRSELNESSQLIDAVVNVLECYYKNSGKAAGLVGHMPNSIYGKLSEKLIPVTLLDDYRTKAYKSRYKRSELYKLNVFVLTASSSKRFYDIIRMTEKSKWWDRTAHHLIVNWSSANNDGCIDSAKYLLKAWERSMINARVICQNRTGGVKLYGYNPYTAEAREPWKVEKIYSRNNIHPFAVFSQEYRNSHGICQTIGADEAKNLAGYPFCRSFQGSRDFLESASHQSSLMVSLLKDSNVIDMIVSTLNATSNRRKGYESSRRQFCKKENTFPSQLFTLYWFAIQDETMPQYTYPTEKIEILAVTQFRGHLTQLEKILSVTDVPSRIGLCLVLLLTLLFFKMFIHQSVTASFLNVVRIVCDTGFANVPDNLRTRLYVGPVLLFAVVMQGIYQGNLAALLTQTIPIRDPMTKQDLIDMDYTIYIRHFFSRSILSDTIFDRHIVTSRRLPNCSRVLHEKPMTACADLAYDIKDMAFKYKFHVVGEPIGSHYASYYLPRITHLEERINMILLRIREADVAVPMYLRGVDKRVSQFEFDEDVQKNEDLKVITLRDLEFAFVILGIGLSCATIAFLIEQIIARRPRSRLD